MIRAFDFRCGAGHVSEHFIDDDTKQVTCPECGEAATRQLATPRAKLEGFTGSFPGAADAWERRRESHMKKERKNQENHGTYK